MDRQIVYAGSIPLDTDLLEIQRNIMTSVGALARSIIGDGGLADGLNCSPGSDPYTVVIGPGSFSVVMAKDAQAFGALPADPTPIMRTGLLLSNTVLQLQPPPDRSQVTCWLIQAAVVDTDTGQVALPYWNAADPALPFTGPGNSGVAQATKRLLRLLLSAKASGPEPFPTGTPPLPDAGWIGLYAVTTFVDKPAVDNSDIQPIWSTQRLRYPLPLLPPAATQQLLFGSSTLWRVPERVRQIRVRLVGAGGGGGGGTAAYSGGGGGAGGYAEEIVPVVAGQLYPITIGFGGAPGGAGSTGFPGGDSAFGDVVHATGGSGGGSQNPNSFGGDPGSGVAGSLLQTGGFGGDGANAPAIPGGNGGTSAFGGGGRASWGGGHPANGSAAGSGGGGGYGTTCFGGAGAGGFAVLEY